VGGERPGQGRECVEGGLVRDGEHSAQLDKKSGRNAERDELWKALDYLRPGDTLVVPSLDRLGRSIQDLIAIVSGLRKRDIGFTSLHEALAGRGACGPQGWTDPARPGGSERGWPRLDQLLNLLEQGAAWRV
jgi:hypothetical protein